MNKENINRLRDFSLSLFSDSDFEPRNDAEREDVQGFFEPFYELIVNAFLTANEKYLDYAEEHSIARQQHCFSETNLHGLLIEYLSKIEGVSISNMSSNGKGLKLGKYTVWVKKIDDSYKPKYNITRASVKRVCQYSENDEKEPVLILGYQLDSMQRISGIYIVYLKGSEIVWPPINVGDIVAHRIQIKPHTPKTESEPVVKVKRGKKKEIN